LHWFFNKQHANTKIRNKNPLLGTLTTGNSITSGDNKISANSKGVSNPDDVDDRDEDGGKKGKNGGDDLLRNNRRYDDNAQFVSRITDIESEVRQINDNTAGYINGHANGLNRELNHLRETNKRWYQKIFRNQSIYDAPSNLKIKIQQAYKD